MRVDLLLIVFLLGKANGGWYATDIKIVEVGLMPLVLLGTAAYPVLSRSAAHGAEEFAPLSRDFFRSVLFASGWLAVGLYCLAPLVLTRLLGNAFQPARHLLPLPESQPCCPARLAASKERPHSRRLIVAGWSSYPASSWCSRCWAYSV